MNYDIIVTVVLRCSSFFVINDVDHRGPRSYSSPSVDGLRAILFHLDFQAHLFRPEAIMGLSRVTRAMIDVLETKQWHVRQPLMRD